MKLRFERQYLEEPEGTPKRLSECKDAELIKKHMCNMQARYYIGCCRALTTHQAEHNSRAN